MPNNNPNRSSYLHESDYGFAPSYHTSGSVTYNDSPDINRTTRSPPAASELSYPPSSHSGVLAPDPTSPYSTQYRTSSPANTVVPSDSASLSNQYPYQPSYPTFNPPSSAGDLGLVPEHQHAYHDPYSTEDLSDERGVASSGWGQAQHEEDDEERRTGLVRSAAGMGTRGGLSGGDLDDEESGKKEVRFSGMGYADPSTIQRPPALGPPTIKEKLLAQVGLGRGRNPIEQQIENKRRGIGKQTHPYGAWALATAMIAVMIYELIRNKQLTGSVIAIKPNFNWMIGPQSTVLINMGARFVPCMKDVTDAPLTYPIACFNNTASTISTSDACTIGEICGLATTAVPNQTYRFFYPIFLHAGVVHIALNLMVLLSAGAQIEREIGTLSFLIIFFAGAIFGFELGGNFALPGVPSVGASGGVFALISVGYVDLAEHWQFKHRPKLQAFFLALELLLMIGMGYIPYLIDNFSHLGGLAVGLLLGVILYPCISTTKLHKIIVWCLRVVAVVLLILGFVLVTINFFKENSNSACEWCRYLSCLPVAQTNYCKGTGLPSITSTTSTSKRLLWNEL